MSLSPQDRILHDLKLIASLQEGDKVHTQNGVLCIEHNSAITSILRWCRGDCRLKSFAIIQHTLLESLRLAETTIQSYVKKRDQKKSFDVIDMSQRNLLARLYRELESAVGGLRRLKITYVSDVNISANIDVLRESVLERLAAFKYFFSSSCLETSFPQSEISSENVLEGFIVFDNIDSIVLERSLT